VKDSSAFRASDAEGGLELRSLRPGTSEYVTHSGFEAQTTELVTKNRLEAFSDGVLAIIIAIMVLKLNAPTSPSLAVLHNLWPIFVSYVQSFLYVGIYWDNHHHLFHAATRVSASILWANLHLLFWLSLLPFATAWVGQTRMAVIPTISSPFRSRGSILGCRTGSICW